MNISVVIPMYNSRNTIINTLDSIKNQTAISCILEIIIVNDGSKDDSLKLVNKYKEDNPNLPILIVDKTNGGVSTARNKGMEIAKGDWIALLDSDDEWLPNKIEYQIDIIKNNPQIEFLGGPFNNRILKILWRKIDYLYKANVYDICIKNFPQPSTVIFKKKIFEEIGGFDELQRYAEDGNYFVKICSKYNLYYDPKLLIIYDSGKRGFGERGLSSNLKKMYHGNIKNIREYRNMKIIKFGFYLFLRSFYLMKYIRRIIISKIK
ncbi:glycosyltransferase family A protein [Halocella sp. SP3-1]|uniref:glycosyltransferase family 2 protein n=1 Tax=Halocella sp. SP3-1 TaxID=2382161 RepID=UPI000F75B598|nr:glycosyltransferase family A protein [Halocella sp. SP3-1]AZO93481.1 glycosyltransferase family 2 protein [Halocella sp. SP3-1]